MRPTTTAGRWLLLATLVLGANAVYWGYRAATEQDRSAIILAVLWTLATAANVIQARLNHVKRGRDAASTRTAADD